MLKLSLDFLKSLATLPSERLKKIPKLVQMLDENPNLPSLRLEHLAAVDLLSARLDDGYRVILTRRGSDYVLLQAGKHDDAYDWAERVGIPPRTMELQIDVDWATGSNVPREMLSRPEAQRRLNVRTSGASVDDGLKIGSIHSWADLKQRFAWDTDKHGYFLPEKNGRIVCACLRADLNPSAPWEILVGTEAAHIRKAEMLIREMSPIPVFIKLAVDQWEYWGEFRFDRCDSNLEQITGMLPQHRLSDTSMVLFLKEAT